MKSDVKVLEVHPFYLDFDARTALKFGSVVVPKSRYCQVKVLVETMRDRRAEGWGGIFLMDFWAFPSEKVEHPLREQAMQKVTEGFARAAQEYGQYAHPIEIFTELEGELDSIRREVSREMELAEEVPMLAALVAASPIDAAIHDAFGKANGISTYDGYGPEFMDKDLSHHLGRSFRGRYISDYIKKRYETELPVFHLVGGLDKLRKSEVDESDPKDGLPNSLEEWIERDGLNCLKVKLKGKDLEWDLNRILEVASIAREVHKRLGIEGLHLSVDTNEQCESPGYLVELLAKLKEKDEQTFNELLYIEQPTERDLLASRHDMSELASIKPVIVDESLLGPKEMDIALRLGWSGIALKTCKTQTMSLILAAKAEALKVPYTIQDLTNPGIALIQSAGLAARLNPLMGLEANSCQFFPGASEPEEKVHPGVFRRRKGKITTESIQGPGLGFRIEEIGRKS